MKNPEVSEFIPREQVVAQIEAFDEWEAGISALATKGYTIAINMSISTPEMLYSTFPAEWARYYKRNIFMVRDPVLHWGGFNNGYIRWSEINLKGLLRSAYYGRVLEAAAEHGLSYGATFVTRNNDSHNRKCFLSVARHDRELTKEELEFCWEKFQTVLNGFRVESGLTNGEIEVLQQIAMGLTQEHIADALGVSRDTVKKRLEKARNVPGANNAVHAVVIAIKSGIISV